MGPKVKNAIPLILAVALSGCAAGIRGGVVTPGSEEAVPEHHEPTFVYGGQRGVTTGVSTPHYRMARVVFNDVTVSMRLPEGWTAERYGVAIRLENAERGGVIMIYACEYPHLEVASIHGMAERDDDVEVSPLAIDIDARHATTFAIATQDGQSIIFLGLMTDISAPDSGVLLAGHWPTEHADDCRLDLLFIADSITMTRAPASSCTPRG